MPGVATLKAIGDWKKEVGVTQQTCLAVSMEVIGKDGEGACRQYITFGARSASAMTTQAPKNRPIEHDFSSGRDLPFLTVYPKSGPPTRVYKFQFVKVAGDSMTLSGTWEKARSIANRGLARRAWLWSLGKMGVRAGRPPIRGTSRLLTIKQPNVNGYIKENLLNYIQQAMPAGWEQSVETKVGNRVMGTARNKLLANWRRAVGAAKGAKIPNEDLARFFMQGEST